MFLLYNTALIIAAFFIKIAAFFNKKVALFYRGRKEVFNQLSAQLTAGRPTIWMHAASLGEYEQGLPVLELLMESYPNHQFLVTFFSPSGYEIVARRKVPYPVVYLPLDTRKNAVRFIRLVQPKIALFVKYEIWPNFFDQLHKLGVPLFIISARFQQRQAFFRSYGGFLRKSLTMVTHFFVQDNASKNLLSDLGHSNVTVTGDTRFDRVVKLRGDNTALPEVERFCAGRPCLVAGSTWPEDEEILISAINNSNRDARYIIAPHNIDLDHISKIKAALKTKWVAYSDLNEQNIAAAQVLILDTIGLLSRVYRFGDIAYVGGGFATGLHNTLEPAVFGVPIVIGPKFSEFKEARDLVQKGGAIPVVSGEEFELLLEKLFSDPQSRRHSGRINTEYIDQNTGASVQILSHLRTYL